MRNAADWFGLLAIGLIACGDEEELVAISEPTGPPIATPCALGDPGCDLGSMANHTRD